MYGSRPDENLDPRRATRGVRTRDFASASRSMAMPTLPTLLARLLVRLGIAR